MIVNIRDRNYLQLPIPDSEIPNEWYETCRQMAYRFYSHAINRRFEQLPGVAAIARHEWDDLTGHIDSAAIGEKSLAELGLKVRLLNLLENVGILTLQQLEDVRPEVLMGLSGVNKTTLDNLEAFCLRVRLRGDEGKK